MLTAVPFNTIALDLQSAMNSAQNSLSALLNTYQSGDNASIPFLGSSLGNAAQLAPQVLAALSVLSSTDPSTSVPDAFVHAFGPMLVNDSDAQGAAGDVHLPNGVASDGSFQAYMRLHVAINPLTTNFKTGLPALPLQLAGAALDCTVNSQVDYELSFAYSATVAGNTPHTVLAGGHPLTGNLSGNGHELVLISNAQLPTSFNGTATLGFVQGTIGVAPNKTSSLSVTATADQFEGTPVRGSLVFNADAYLQLTGGIAGVPAAQAFPTISTTIHLQWDNSAGGGPHVSFGDVSLNLGQFINNVLGPVLGSIQSVTSPIKPVIDALTQSLPVLSDISHFIGGGDISLMSITSIAASYAGLGPLAGLFSTIATFIQEFNGFDPNAGTIDLGDFSLDGFNVQNASTAGNPLDLANHYLTSFDTSNLPGNPSAYSSLVNILPVSADVKANLQKLVSSLNGNPNSIDLEFPILNSPGKAIFNLLMGRDSDLITLKGNLAVDASESTGADLFGMGLSFNGAVHLAGQLTFAYDTYGLRELVRDGTSNVGNDILDGFYLKTDSNLQIGGSIGISAGISAGIASANVTGSVGTPNGQSINVTIDTSKDTDHDGKLRFSEFPSNPLNAFNVGGELDAGLTFEIQIGVKTPLGFLGYEKDFDIAHTIIVSFNPASPPPDVTLASPAEGVGAPLPGNGLVQLFIGKQASRRSGVDNTDGGPNGSGETYVIKHIGDDTDAYGGETIEIDAFGKKQTIHNVKTIYGNGDAGDLRVTVEPGVEANVSLNNAPEFDQNGHAVTGYVNQGHAYLTDLGTGQALLTAGRLDSSLSGGAGTNILTGGAGNDTFTAGTGSNIVVDNAGDNLIIDQDPAGYISLSSNSTAFNTLKIVPAKTTTSITATASSGDLAIQTQESNGNSAFSAVSHVSELIVDEQANTAAINIGNLESLNIEEVTVYGNAASSAARSVSVDTPTPTSGNPVFLNLAAATDPNVNGASAHGISIVDNSLGGTNVAVLGLTGADTLTVQQHGGTTDIGDLGLSGGTIILDDSSNQSAFSEATTLTTPIRTGGSTIATNEYGPVGSVSFRIQAQGDPDVVFKNASASDSITINVSVSPFGGTNHVTIDASALTCALHVNASGTALAVNNILVSAVGDLGAVSVDGESTATSVTIGAGQLGPIEGNVSVTHAVLTVDNSAAAASSILTLAGGSFAGWDASLFLIAPPILSYSGLETVLTVEAGVGDRFDLESTPAGVGEVNIKNLFNARNSVYLAGASTPLVLDGDFELSLGQRLSANGIITTLNTLHGLANVPVTFNVFRSVYSPSFVEFWNAAAQSYAIGGNGNLVVTDQTDGPSVTINGFLAPDQVLIELPGGSVNADLTTTGPENISLDGSARLMGVNVAAPLNVVAHARPGAVFMLPTGDDSSVLRLFNNVYLSGVMPQDSLNVYDSDGSIGISNEPTQAAYAQFATVAGDPATVSVGQPFDFTVRAEDAGGGTLTSYTSQVQWYAYNQTTGTYVSSDYESFAAADQGQHAFHGLVLTEPGTYSLGFDDGWNVSSFIVTATAAGQGSPIGQVGQNGALSDAATETNSAVAAATSDAPVSAAPFDALAANFAVASDPVANISYLNNSVVGLAVQSPSVETATQQTAAAPTPPVNGPAGGGAMIDGLTGQNDELTPPLTQAAQFGGPISTDVARQPLPDMRILAMYYATDSRMNPGGSSDSILFRSAQPVVVVQSPANDAVAGVSRSSTSSEGVGSARFETRDIPRASEPRAAVIRSDSSLTPSIASVWNDALDEWFAEYESQIASSRGFSCASEM